MVLSYFQNISNTKKLFSIVLVNFILALPGLWVPYFNVDETTNGLFARLINSGDLDLKFFLGNTYLLTHYLYALVFKIFPTQPLLAMHIVHAVWKGCTVLAVYWAGKEFRNEKVGLWAALFYATYSYCFMSKDFHSPSAESFSLLPLALACSCFFGAVNRGVVLSYLFCGLLSGVAIFFKAPVGVIVVAVNITILVIQRRVLVSLAVYNFSFLLVLIAPALLIAPFGEGFRLMYARLSETNSIYINFYSELSFLYWGIKFLIRSLLIFTAQFVAVLFAFYSLRYLFARNLIKELEWRKLLFLTIFFFLLWGTVALGRRVFYHYFVFLILPLSILGGYGIQALVEYQNGNKFLRIVRKYCGIFMMFPIVGFSIESALNYSTQPPNLNSIVEYVKSNTKQDDRIYVWGFLPQIYFYSDRLPASSFFWSDVLAGTLPGSPAMEYIRATGTSLDLQQKIFMDFKSTGFWGSKDVKSVSKYTISDINETELFNLDELLIRVENPYWKMVFRDFFKKPPVLFIDASPLNYRGFANYPISKYELLKRFIADNYELETRVQEMIIYRLKK